MVGVGVPSQDRSAIISVIYTAPVAFLSARNLSEITADCSSPSSSPSHHYQLSLSILSSSSHTIISQLVVEPRVAEVAQCKEYKVWQWQWAVLGVQPPEMWGQPDRIIIFIRVVFVDSSHHTIHNYQLFLFNKKKVH